MLPRIFRVLRLASASSTQSHSRHLVAFLIATPLAICLFVVFLFSQRPLALYLAFVTPFWLENAARGTINSTSGPSSTFLSPLTLSALIPPDSSPQNAENASGAFGIASRVYVISLPERTDRRQQMDYLRAALGLEWSYVDALNSSNPAVTAISRQVRLLRQNVAKYATLPGVAYDGVHTPVFHWPDDIAVLARQHDPLLPAGADLWATRPAFPNSINQLELLSVKERPRPGMHANQLELACTQENKLLAHFYARLPPHRILTAAKIACWHSHMQVIREIVNNDDDAPAIVLEDDIDMERDIHARLKALWPALPADWDIVYLGHCWSNESHHAAMYTVFPFFNSSKDDANLRGASALHPSAAPKCTHAYALSRIGARRVLLHLRHAPFAYSRAVDQALSWLVRSGRLRAYSVVPPVVVQRKVADSDVMPGRGSPWKEKLMNGVFGQTE